MSRRASILLAAVMTAMVGVPTAHGQSTDSLRQRVAELASQWEEADRVALRAESLAEAQLERTSIREGVFDLTVVGPLPNARRGVDRAWEEIRATFGARADELPPVEMTLTVAGRHATLRTEPSGSTLGFGLGDAAPSELIARQLVSAFLTTSGVNAPPATRQWLGTRVTVPLRAAELRRAYADLVTTPHHATGPCVLGDVGACRVLLGLVDGDPLTAWYDADDRYNAVMRLDEPNERFYREPAAHRERCIVAHDDTACRAFLRWRWGDRAPTPAPISVRNVLARIAYRLGGGANSLRLVEADGTVAERLSRAAGVPLDELVAAWLDALHPEAGATPAPFPVWTGALMWIVVLSGMALRSSRWK